MVPLAVPLVEQLRPMAPKGRPKFIPRARKKLTLVTIPRGHGPDLVNEDQGSVRIQWNKSCSSLKRQGTGANSCLLTSFDTLRRENRVTRVSRDFSIPKESLFCQKDDIALTITLALLRGPLF